MLAVNFSVAGTSVGGGVAVSLDRTEGDVEGDEVTDGLGDAVAEELGDVPGVACGPVHPAISRKAPTVARQKTLRMITSCPGCVRSAGH